MAIKLDCPRCKKPLSVPSKKIGRYVNCPRCGGRFWVPENASPDAPGSESTVSPADSGRIAPAPQPPQLPTRPPATIAMGSAATAPPGEIPPGGVVAPPPAGHNSLATHDTPTPPPASATGTTPAEEPPCPLGETSQRPPDGKGQRAARFISAEAAQSTLKLAEDGHLPELHLAEGQLKEKKQATNTTVNPLVLFGLLAISVAFCVGLVLVDFGPPENQAKDQARQAIEERFFPRTGEEPLRYQEYLMIAQRANTRGDRQTEREMYQKVLDMLRQERPVYVEDGHKKWSLTTSPDKDEDLEDLISILLSND